MNRRTDREPLGIRLRKRLTRLRPDRVAGPYLAWAIACWIATLVLAAVILIPGLTDAVTAQGDGVIATFSAPAGFRIVVLVAGAVLAGAAVVWVLLRDRTRRARTGLDTIVRELVLLPVALFPVLALMADSAWIRAAIGAVPALTFLILAHLTVRRAGTAVIAGLGVLAALPWLWLAVYQLTAAGSRSDSWLWVALFGVAAAFAAFGSYYGVARAAESRTARLTFLSREDLHPLLVLGLVAAAIVLTGLRLTVARDLFPVPDPQLWQPQDRSAVSWVIAGIVSGLLVIVAVRAARAPLRRFGERRVVAALAGLGNLELVISVLVIGGGMLFAIVSGLRILPTDWEARVPSAKLVGVAVLFLIVLHPVFKGTAARWLGLLTTIFLIPTTLNSALVVAGVQLPKTFAGFPATPVQVLLILLAAALVLALWNLVRPSRAVSASVVARLAAVPFLAVHAGWLLPTAWSDLGRAVVVVGVLLALFWLMPPAAADPQRHAYTVVGASAAQLLALAVFLLAIPSLFADGALTVLGLLWLSIPVMAALLIDTRDETGARDEVGSTQ